MTDRELQEWGASRRMPDPSPAEAARLVARARNSRWRWVPWLLLPVVPAGMVAVAAAVVLAIVLWRGPVPGALPPAPEIAEIAPPVLGTGTHALGADEIEVAGAVVARREALRTILDLQEGAVTVHAAKRAPGEQLVVVSEEWSVAVVGTRFTVVRDPFSVVVAEGVVTVGRGEEQWTLRAGDRFERGRPVRPAAPPPELSELRRQLLAGDSEGARAGLGKRLSHDPGDTAAWTLLGQLEARAGRRDEAVAAWHQVIARGAPAEAQRGRFEAAVLLEDRPSEVVPLLRAFLTTPDPLSAEARLRLGRAELAVGDPAARQTLEQLVRSHPGTGPAEIARGLLGSL